MATPEQRQVAAGMGAAAAMTILVGAACGMSGWRPWSFGSAPPGRLLYGLACILPPAACLGVAIGRVAAHRFFSPQDMAGAALTEPTPELRVLSAILQNTLEQTVLTMPAYMAAAMLLPERWIGGVAAASILFVTGRAGFARGYRAGAAKRAFGFALSFYPSLLLLAASLIAVASQ